MGEWVYTHVDPHYLTSVLVGVGIVSFTAYILNVVTSLIYWKNISFFVGARDSVVVEILSYKPEGRGIASR
jgi:hypothetical protein